MDKNFKLVEKNEKKYLKNKLSTKKEKKEKKTKKNEISFF